MWEERRGREDDTMILLLEVEFTASEIQSPQRAFLAMGLFPNGVIATNQPKSDKFACEWILQKARGERIMGKQRINARGGAAMGGHVDRWKNLGEMLLGKVG
ncbi:unnamed protein product [Calypogeia fissa]